MAKDKRSSNRPQAKHKKNCKKSQHDKRKRLDRSNTGRKKTTHAKVPLVGAMQKAVSVLQGALDLRIAFRLPILIAGMLLANDRRTASAWFVSAGVHDDWDRFYDCLKSIGRSSHTIATAVLEFVVDKFSSQSTKRILLAMDDSPTPRYGKHVEGAGVHHNPTGGPADGEWLYGHNWVCLSFLAQHPLWGVIGLPLRSMLYVRQIDVPKLKEKYGWKFQTKHELGVELMTWVMKSLKKLGVKARVWLVVDGAYAARPFLKPLIDLNVVVISRLRKDACLKTLPSKRKEGQRGRPRIYGTQTINLASRASHPKGWETVTCDCRGKQVTRHVKTFLATSRLVGGVIRVVIVKFEDGSWAPYFATDTSLDVRDILESVAARWAIEEHFHDVKEVWGAGKQQVRNVWSNVGCWNLNGWVYTLVELCAWDMKPSELIDRSDRAWDNPSRRPSHADRRRAISKEMLEKRFMAALPSSPDTPKIHTLFKDLIALAA